MISIYISDLPAVPVKQKYKTEHQRGLELLSYGLKELYQLEFSAEQLPDQLEKGEYGKTYLREYPEIYFNISHCDGKAVCAFADSELGVDAEKKDQVNEKIFRRVFTQSEQNLLKRQKGNEKEYRESFYRLWTLKESRIKQNGLGMSIPLTEFSFEFEPGEICTKYTGKTEYVRLSDVRCTESDLQFIQYRFAEEWIVAICIEKKIGRESVNLQYIETENLQEKRGETKRE